MIKIIYLMVALGVAAGVSDNAAIPKYAKILAVVAWPVVLGASIGSRLKMTETTD